MKFLQVIVFLSLVLVVGCTKEKEGESRKTHFSGDFCEIEKRHQGPFPSGKETIVDALQPDDVLVAVNGYPLTKKTFDEVMALKAKQLMNVKGSNQAYLNNQLADFRKNYVPLFVNQRLLIDKARELNVIPKEELERRVNDLIQKQAKARNMTVEDFVKSFLPEAAWGPALNALNMLYRFFEEEEPIDLDEIIGNLKKIAEEEKKVDAEIQKYCDELGIQAPIF